MNTIELSHISKTYKAKKGKLVHALSDLSLTVGKGEVFGFLGPNGAGKSTTIKILMGQIAPTCGSSSLCGFSSSSSEARKTVGYLPENPSFYDFMTAREYLRFVGSVYQMSPDKIRKESDRVLTLVELSEAADRPMRGYSKGMVQRLGLAQALLHDPDVFVLDEPMSGLDPLGRALVKEVISGLRASGKTVFFSTHIIADVEAICDRVGVVAKGNLLALDRVSSILDSGIEGYTVQYSQNDGVRESVDVLPDAVSENLKRLIAGGANVERIEPRRKDLESFFLGLVSKSQNKC